MKIILFILLNWWCSTSSTAHDLANLKDLPSLNTQKATLESIAGNDCYAASYARGILRVLNGGDTYREPMPIFASNMMLRTKKKAANQVVAVKMVKMQPNPAKDYVQISYELPESGIALQIVDALGRTVLITTTSSTNGGFTIPTTDWVAGVYRVLLIANEKVIENQSLIIVR
jgi:Secretion system C-terminal sorting domain